MKKLFKKIEKILGPGILFATGFQPLTTSTNAPTLTHLFQSGDLPGFFNAAFTLALSLGAILAVLRIAYAGWKYMSTDAFGKKSDAKAMIRDALIGLLLLLGIWIILNQINPDLLNLDITRDIGGSNFGTPNTQYTPSTETVGQNVVQVLNVSVPAGTLNVNGQGVDQYGNPIN